MPSTDSKPEARSVPLVSACARRRAIPPPGAWIVRAWQPGANDGETFPGLLCGQRQVNEVVGAATVDPDAKVNVALEQLHFAPSRRRWLVALRDRTDFRRRDERRDLAADDLAAPDELHVAFRIRRLARG